ncbi:MAG TPA: neutral/alkaline non-lysosomal ceramidase N-terminal domain-containing protein [Nevskiaceae bacterium]|nr:neutral/alkaline non-lysosomal ceramidase N-terminal domain-containing protein [Nevskiaceae bacterium]
MRRSWVLSLSLVLVACGNSAPPTAPAPAAGLACVLDSPRLAVGAGRDASGPLEIPVSAGPTAGPCAGRGDYRLGSGLYDITGVIGGTSGMGYESLSQVLLGLHTRQYARAFVVESPCNGERVAFISTDTGMIFHAVRQGVLERIAADPRLAARYGVENLMLSATHTHSGPAGYSHHEAFNLFHLGHDADTYEAIVGGIVEALRRAHENLEAHPQPGRLQLAVGELLDTNINRSQPAFDQNPLEERARFLDARGQPQAVDKRMVQLDFRRAEGREIGLINWFGVHTTSIGNTNTLVSSDNKGYASLLLERLKGTDYRAPLGADTYVAAFAQTDEGDASPNIFIYERPFAERGGGADEFESNAISGTKQLAGALRLSAQGRPLQGPVQARQFHVAFDAVEITDPVVLASLRHPAALDAPVKRTCQPAAGVSFGAGAEDGPGPTVEGVSCASSPDLIAAAVADFTAASAGKLPPNALSAVLLCNVDQLPGLDYGCHAEKPILFPLSDPFELVESATPIVNKALPFQIFRIGSLAIVGLPWEITTMAARRIRETVLEVLAPVGVDTVVIAGLANDFVNYLTTREEYAIQQYEGASTFFGPWSLAAVQQETRRLALSLRDGEPSPAGVPMSQTTVGIARAPYVPADDPGSEGFGGRIEDVAASAARGETVRARFRAGHPRNDRRTQQSYAYVERETASGWVVVAEDRDPELVYRWTPQEVPPVPAETPAGASTASVEWTIPADAPAGRYRLRHVGSARRSPAAALEPYEGLSSVFEIGGTPAPCP